MSVALFYFTVCMAGSMAVLWQSHAMGAFSILLLSKQGSTICLAPHKKNTYEWVGMLIKYICNMGSEKLLDASGLGIAWPGNCLTLTLLSKNHHNHTIDVYCHWTELLGVAA